MVTTEVVSHFNLFLLRPANICNRCFNLEEEFQLKSYVVAVLFLKVIFDEVLLNLKKIKVDSLVWFPGLASKLACTDRGVASPDFVLLVGLNSNRKVIMQSSLIAKLRILGI